MTLFFFGFQRSETEKVKLLEDGKRNSCRGVESAGGPGRPVVKGRALCRSGGSSHSEKLLSMMPMPVVQLGWMRLLVEERGDVEGRKGRGISAGGVFVEIHQLPQLIECH